MNTDGQPAIRLRRWLDRSVVAVSALVLFAGFGQFGAVAALGDVAESFGEVTAGDSIAEQAGLSGSALGAGLAVIRLASLLSLPLASLADRMGRRWTLLSFCVLGLLLTASAALSQTYWWFVALIAASRPFLTATDTIGEVSAAEQTGARDRTKAIALVAAAYGIGSGLVAVVRGVAGGQLGFRGVFALALVPMVLVPLAARQVTEPDRYRAAQIAKDKPLPVVGAVSRRFRGRLAVLVAVVFAVAVISGPVNSFVFLYAENVLGLSSTATATMVVAASVSGLVGLLAGRWLADTVGRRWTGAAAMVLMATAGMVTYGGSTGAAIGGYVGAVAAGSMLAPPVGAIAAELFPTSVRATVAGWTVAFGVLGAAAGLMAFGAMADAYEEFGRAALAVFGPAALVAALFALVPETKSRELEDWEKD